MPALSQDLSALWALIGDGIDVQRPILRAFDVLIFGVQTSVIDWAACAKVRKNLLKAEETILPCFENCSVQDGMAKFYLCLCDANRDPLGAPAPAEKFDDRIYVRSVRR